MDKNSESYLRFVKTEPVANEMEDHVNAVLSSVTLFLSFGTLAAIECDTDVCHRYY